MLARSAEKFLLKNESGLEEVQGPLHLACFFFYFWIFKSSVDVINLEQMFSFNHEDVRLKNWIWTWKGMRERSKQAEENQRGTTVCSP